MGVFKSKHSQFYYKMKEMNKCIAVYKKIFDNRMPGFQESFYKRKNAELLAEIENKKKVKKSDE